MIQKLVKHGDDLALVIDASVLKELGIDETVAVQLLVEGRELRVTPVEAGELSPEQFEELHNSISERYSKTFKRLAEES